MSLLFGSLKRSARYSNAPGSLPILSVDWPTFTKLPTPSTSPIMMCTTTFNPLVQGWRWPYGVEPTPVVYGALPSSMQPAPKAQVSPRDAIVFHLSHYRPDVLNCLVSDAHGRKHLRISTNDSEGSPTVWRDVTSQRAVALVDWSQRPSAMIEIPGLLGRTAVQDWIPLCDDHTTRYMELRGVHYSWVPVGEFICLYRTGDARTSAIARVSRASNGATLELSRQALLAEASLFELSVVAATLFLSGQRFD
ncbi:unnamed protein product [Peniophora sp. CBMAI 1063]|nr:unnamed protein product [Peniophora sp. CBMAI 1063]